MALSRVLPRDPFLVMRPGQTPLASCAFPVIQRLFLTNGAPTAIKQVATKGVAAPRQTDMAVVITSGGVPAGRYCPMCGEPSSSTVDDRDVARALLALPALLGTSPACSRRAFRFRGLLGVRPLDCGVGGCRRWGAAGGEGWSNLGPVESADTPRNHESRCR